MPSAPRSRVRAARPSLPALVLLAAASLPARAQRLSEVVADHVGPDDHEYVEIYVAPGTPYTSSSILVVQGTPAGNPGRVDQVFTTSTTNGAGFWTTGYLTSSLESPTFTLLLANGFTGAVGDDLDPDDDGVLDASPWTTLLDGVALTDGAAGSRTYVAAVLGPGLGGNATPPGGVSRWPYFKDTDAASDWRRNDFDGEGLAGFTGTLVSGEARNTPGRPTTVPLVDYYASVDPSTPATLRATLHALIKDHVQYPYSTTGTTLPDTWDILESADEDPNDPTKALDVYKNESYTKVHLGNSFYNREHSWPNSYGFPSSGHIAYTDCHHLFISHIGYNADRGNLPFGTCSSGCTERTTTVNGGFGGGSGTYPGNSSWFSAGTSAWETWGRRRGDVARAQLYLDVRYDGGNHAVTGATEPDLILTDDVGLIQGTSLSPAYMGRLSTILAWHAQDPPDPPNDAIELRRNDVVESYQGNRNPFIDHPEWASCLFQGVGCAPATGRFFTVAPCRLLDTRPASALASGVSRTVTFHGACAIPASARSVSVNATVTEANGAGYVTFYPADQAPPATSTLNFVSGRTRANNAILKLSSDGSGQAKALAAVEGNGTVHLVVDVNGYFD